MSFFNTIFDYLSFTFAPTLLSRLEMIITAPIRYPEMIWILFPMIITLLLMTFYFGRYRREELGWNTAVGNALVLLFVSMNLFQHVFPESNPFRALLIFIRMFSTQGLTGDGVFPGLVAGGIFVYSLLLLTADFYHWLPKQVAFFVSSSLPINILAYFGIIFVYSRTAGDTLLLDGYTLLAFVTLFCVVFVLLLFLQSIEPHKDEEDVDEDAPKPQKGQMGLTEKTNNKPLFDETPPDSELDDAGVDPDDPVVTGEFDASHDK